MSGDDANREVGRYICSRYGCHLVSEVPTEMGAMCREHASPLLFEIQYPYRYVGPGPRFVPWEFVKPHERQARSNHGGQTLARLSERGDLLSVSCSSSFVTRSGVLHRSTWTTLSRWRN